MYCIIVRTQFDSVLIRYFGLILQDDIFSTKTTYFYSSHLKKLICLYFGRGGSVWGVRGHQTNIGVFNFGVGWFLVGGGEGSGSNIGGRC